MNPTMTPRELDALVDRSAWADPEQWMLFAVSRGIETVRIEQARLAIEECVTVSRIVSLEDEHGPIYALYIQSSKDPRDLRGGSARAWDQVPGGEAFLPEVHRTLLSILDEAVPHENSEARAFLREDAPKLLQRDYEAMSDAGLSTIREVLSQPIRGFEEEFEQARQADLVRVEAELSRRSQP